MSASESESGSAELLDATPAASTSRRSNRIAAQSESASQIRETLRARGITPAPGLELSQLQDLASNGVVCETPVRVQRPASSGPAAAPGRKRTRKTHHLAPQAKRKRASAVSAPPDHPDAALHAPDVALTSTLQSLVNSMNAIDARLQCLENAQASSSSSAMFSVPPLLHPPAPVMAPAPVPQPSSSFATAPDVPQHSLASAVPAPTIGRPYVPFGANISPRLRSKILQGKDINLISLILPSPECGNKISSGENFTAVIKSADPRLARDLSIGEFVVAFGIYRDVICSVYPERRQELDSYLALIGDLNLRYGKNIFYQYHKGFSSKAALYIAQANIRLNWSVLDTELLVMLVGGAQAVACKNCGNTGHSESLCPLVPFFPQERSAFPAANNEPSSLQKEKTDSRGRKQLQGRAPPLCVPSQVSPSAAESPWFKDLLKIHPSTPINVPALASELSSHPDSVFVDHLLSGLSQGFRVGVVSSLSSSYVSKNLQSAIQEPDLVSQLLKKELDKGYLIGPFNSSPFPVFRTSPVGIATRKYSGKKRLIVDLSAPRSGPVPSINSLIPPAPFSLHYSTVDNAIKLIKLSGQGAWLSKADITDAFKICPIHPSQWHLFGLKWESKLYFAVRLTFGCRSSPSIFNQVSEALCWIFLNRVRVPSLLHFLDDFLLIDPPHDNSGSSLSKLKLLFQYLGVPLSDEKTSGPATRLEFLGITLDTVEMKASLPAEKLERIREITHSVTAYQEITKQQMLSLLGHLNFAMRVVPQGRSFISRLLDMAASVPNLRDKILLDDGCRSDLKFWSHLLNHWNGVSFFYDDLVYSSDSLKFFTDAAPSVGFGGYFQGQWFASRWPKSFPKVDSSSALYEIYPIAVACHVWGKSWKRKRIAVQCDNEAVVGIINKGRSASREIMPFMRSITWLSVTHNFIITARHVPGRANVIADSLSRFNFQVFKTLCPEASPTPTAVPPLEALALH
ncbi:uncharacterized protein LOC115373572 [Myripristis murdjan]|uniref:uncharacterized protein LOC115373572 n=1 Tax=Myripristis murdjan TaxID=586833 RepID=UPI0011763E35|nr:uncharacterized protein LOC115373572 [Myripristis murdjan]